ncbi:hypothetical protein LINPERHAP1_LOCUS5335 [Linum perenne]
MKFCIVYAFPNKLRKPLRCRKDGTLSGFHTLF